MAQHGVESYAITKAAQTMPRKEGSAKGMERKSRHATMKIALTKSSKEESASGMERWSAKTVAVTGAPTKPRQEECATGTGADNGAVTEDAPSLL